MVYDVIIIGLGPAGISAAIYAKRSGLKTLVIESKMPGGLLNYTNVVNNYPGFINISGPDLSFKMYEHFKSYDIEYKNEEVIDLVDGEIKKIMTSSGEYETKNVIIATGRSRRSLNLPHEEELRGGGISYCAMCDGHFYKDKSVGVVGAGDSSLEEALYLANVVRDVTIIVRGNRLSGNDELVKKVENSQNIRVLFGKNVKELLIQDGKLKGVLLDDGEQVELSGLFVYIGFDPVLPFRSDVGIEKENGYIKVNEDGETNIPGIYAAGDIVKKSLYQIISAESEGAIAATSIIRKLTKKN